MAKGLVSHAEGPAFDGHLDAFAQKDRGCACEGSRHLNSLSEAYASPGAKQGRTELSHRKGIAPRCSVPCFPKHIKNKKTYKNKKQKKTKKNKKKEALFCCCFLSLCFSFSSLSVATSPCVCVCPLLRQTSTYLDSWTRQRGGPSAVRHHTQRCDRPASRTEQGASSKPLLASEANNYQHHYPPF
jgi:hypothetical protein